MPDLSIVEAEFVSQIGQILSNTPYQPYAVGFSEPLNQPFRLMRGWPVDQQLVKDLNATPTITNVTVFSMPGARNTTRFLRQMMNQVVEVPTPSMVATLSGNQITFAGTGATNETIGVSYGGVAGMAMRLSATDTPSTVAASFAAGLVNASASGPVLTIATLLPIGVVVGCDVRMLREVHRQCGLWKISIWASTPQLRDQFAAIIDPNLQGLDRFFFADGSCSGPIVNCGGIVDDVPEKQKLWRRDLHYDVEYPTDTVSIVPVMVLGDLGVNDLTLFTTGVPDGSDIVIMPAVIGGTAVN